jgi:hypothetical protein
MPDLVQLHWFADVATRAVLPLLEEAGQPFALLFWSRDPDGTQHNQGDSFHQLAPGINGPTSKRALQNADRSFAQILSWLDAHPAVKANTDVFVTSDHGFATIGRNAIDRAGHRSTSESAQHAYVDPNGAVDTEKGMLPTGFLAIDLALDFHMNLFDADRRAAGGGGGGDAYRRVRIDGPDAWEHPSLGSGLIGASVQKPDGSDARLVVVAANGGTDLVYVPDDDPAVVRAAAERVLTHDYVTAVFVDDRFGAIPGTLPMSAVGLIGRTTLPHPALVVAFRTFYLDPDDIQTAVLISDTTLQEGQGMHGGFGRDSTLNTMAAAGPHFKQRFVDRVPAGNADVAPTLARVMGFDLVGKETTSGRVLSEALSGGPEPAASCCPVRALESEPALGARTVLYFQEEPGGARYGMTACRVPVGRPALPDARPCRD